MCWVGRPGVVIRAHKIPRRKMYAPTFDGEDVPPASISSIDVTHRTRTTLDTTLALGALRILGR